ARSPTAAVRELPGAAQDKRRTWTRPVLPLRDGGNVHRWVSLSGSIIPSSRERQLVDMSCLESRGTGRTLVPLPVFKRGEEGQDLGGLGPRLRKVARPCKRRHPFRPRPGTMRSISGSSSRVFGAGDGSSSAW